MVGTIGIDLGTTNSCVSYVDDDKTVIIPNSKGNHTTPSVVAFSKNGQILVGEDAVRQAAVNTARTVYSVKRQMGTDWSINIDQKKYNAAEISSLILKKLKEDAEAYLGVPVVNAVITVPAYFNNLQRQATKDAGRIAGLNVLRIINEPTSASLAYGLDHDVAQKIMVYDLGGGTFDVSIIEVSEGVIKVLSTNGDNHLGGDDIDELLCEYLLDEIKTKYSIDLRKDITARFRLRDAAEKAKIELSYSDSATINLPYLHENRGNILNFSYTLSRDRFEELIREIIEKTEVPVRNALNDAGIAPTELGRVLLVGGSTKIPCVQRKVEELTGMVPSKELNPDECVAQGAAVQADNLTGGSLSIYGKDNVLLLDVIPLSFAIETYGGIATRIVSRNTTLPIHYSRVFSTAGNYQRTVEVNVLQGERPLVRDNKSIGKFTLEGIQKAKAGVPKIEVTFDIDVNGILTVSARDLKTGTAQAITITDTERMSETEILRAIRNAQIYEQKDKSRREALSKREEAEIVLKSAESEFEALEDKLDKVKKKEFKKKISELKKNISKIKPELIKEKDYINLEEAKQNVIECFKNEGVILNTDTSVLG